MPQHTLREGDQHLWEHMVSGAPEPSTAPGGDVSGQIFEGLSWMLNGLSR